MVICFVLAGVCLLYWGLIVAYAGIGADFAWIWPFGSVALAAMGFLLRAHRLHPERVPGWILKALLVLGILGGICFASLLGVVVRGMTSKASENLSYVVVLGAQVRGTKPSRALKKRLACAAAYAEKNPETILILSGGQGSGEEITEAQCMRDWLVEQGFPEDRLVLEERSTTTHENLIFSDELTGCKKQPTGILSNDFHVARALMLAKKAGYEKCEGIAAAGDPLMEVHYMVREVFALVKAKLTGTI